MNVDDLDKFRNSGDIISHPSLKAQGRTVFRTVEFESPPGGLVGHLN